MESTYDYTELVDTLIEVVKTTTGLVLIESNSAGKQPDYSFWFYSFTSPYIPITNDVVNGEVFECVISLTNHSLSSLESLNYATLLHKKLREFDSRMAFYDKNITVVSTGKIGKRDSLISIEYERTTGFDLRLRIKDQFKETIPNMENIEI